MDEKMSEKQHFVKCRCYISHFTFPSSIVPCKRCHTSYIRVLPVASPLPAASAHLGTNTKEQYAHTP